MGCELSYLDDVFWNHGSILGKDESFGYENATAIAYALKELKKDLGARTDENLTLTTLLSVSNGLKSIGKNIHQHGQSKYY